MIPTTPEEYERFIKAHKWMHEPTSTRIAEAIEQAKEHNAKLDLQERGGKEVWK